jgi:hypothetical protein
VLTSRPNERSALSILNALLPLIGVVLLVIRNISSTLASVAFAHVLCVVVPTVMVMPHLAALLFSAVHVLNLDIENICAATSIIIHDHLLVDLPTDHQI